MDEHDSIERLLLELLRVLEPLGDAALVEPQPEGLLRLAADVGLDLELILVDTSPLTAITASISDVYEQLRAIVDAGGVADLRDLPAHIRTLRDLIDAVRQLDQLQVRPDIGAAIGEVGGRLLEYLLLRYLRYYHRGVYGFLRLTGVIEEGDPEQAILPTFDFVRLARALADPADIAVNVFGWGTPALRQYDIITAVRDVLNALGVPALVHQPDPADAAAVGSDPERENPDSQLRVPLARYVKGGVSGQVGVAMLPLPEVLPELPGFAFIPFGAGETAEEVDLGDQWRFSLAVSADAPAAYGIMLRPSGVQMAGLLGAGPPVSLAVHLGVTRNLPYDRQVPLLGSPDLIALSISTVGVFIDFEFADDRAFSLRFPIQGIRLDIAAGGDGFLAQVLPAGGLSGVFDLTVGWSSTDGLIFDGSASLEVSLPAHLSLGPIELNEIHLAVMPSSDGRIRFTASLTAALDIGPIAASVDRLGAALDVELGRGSFGFGNISLGFKPPNGLGLAIDAGPVSGGGYLFFDPPNGRYAGVLQLSIYSIAVTAIGLLDTRGADGQPLPAPGFSFLIIISAEFPPIQLGYGFTLNGVGGLAGIHRTVVTEALQSGIRSGTVDHILFPDDPIRQAPQIISDLRTIFPVQANRFVFGPMALLGWGSPTLIELELGIILEVPSPIRIILLGQLNLVLPDKEAPVVELHIDILGILDFGRRLISIDATLRDSRVAAFNISGDMALRLSWGEKANFAASVGGLNPHFQPPADFPTLRRAMISFGFEDNPRIGVQTYMAVTSNSVQFGARAELFYEAGGFNIHGWLIFDALVIFRPLFFRFDFSQGFALRRGDDPFLALHVTGTLTGPKPYHIWGEGCISILFWDLCIGFDVEFGERQTVELPQQDVWPLLAQAIADVRNWTATLPQDVHVAVSLRQPPASQVPILVHPMGSATLRQRVIPLNRTLDKYGEFRISGANRFEIDSVAVGNEPGASWSEVTDLFAPGQFEELTDAEKLSRDSFEPMVAGVSVASRHIEHGAAQIRSVMYETVIVDSPWDSRVVQPYSISVDEQLARSERGAKANSLLARSGTSRYAPAFGSSPPFTFDDDEYVIVSTTDLSIQPEFGRARSKGELYRGLRDHVSAHPEDSDRYQVAALSEVGSQ